MRVLIPLDGSAIGESAVEAVAALPPERNLDVTLLMVVDSAGIQQTADGRYYHVNTPHGTTGGQLLWVKEEMPQIAESRSQALERVRTEAETYLRLLSKRLLPGLTPEIQLEFDNDVAGTISQKAEQGGADFIVMATHGRTGVSHAVLGSVAEKVVRKATVPVLLVGPKLREKLEKVKKAAAASG